MEKKIYKVCLRCGRKLKTLKSKERGYGDVCYEKSKVSRKNKLF